MSEREPAARLRHLPVVAVLGREVPLASTFRSRLLGLARLDCEEAGQGLLIPRCASVHTFGMRFAVDVCFLDAAGDLLAVWREIPARRVVSQAGARAVLEVPSAQGGEFPRPVS